MLKVFRASTIIILLSVLLVTSLACKAEYSLRVSVGGGQGNVTPISEKYTSGDTATIAAVPASGWEFDHWAYGGQTGSDNPLRITMDSDKTVQAYFNETVSTTPTPTPTAVPSPTPSPTSAPTPASTPPSNYYYLWVTGTWNACSVPCGGGVQMRTVFCICGDTATVVPDAYCSMLEPAYSQPCNMDVCPTSTPATAPSETPTPTPTPNNPTHQ